MRLETIQEIAQTCEDFFKKIISHNDKYAWDKFLEERAQNGDNITEYTDAATSAVFEVDIDYGNMCFTVSDYKGTARLSPIATYYHLLGEASEIDGTDYSEINIELFEE